MKKTIFLLGIIMGVLYNANGQTVNGKRVFSISAATVDHNEFNSASIYSPGSQKIIPAKNHALKYEISFGKINAKNLLTGGGISLVPVFLTMDTTNGVTRKGSGLSYAAFVLLKKYKPLGKGIYYTPSVISGPEFTSYDINDELNSKIIQRDVSAGGFIRIRPVSVVFPLSFENPFGKGFTIGADLGEVYLSWRRQKSDVYSGGLDQRRYNSSANFLLGFPIALRLGFIF